jgi:hypothetical protein
MIEYMDVNHGSTYQKTPSTITICSWENIVDHVVANNIMTTHGMTFVTPKTTRCPFQQVLFDTII